MVVFADTAHFLSELYPSFSSLCSDPEVCVRRSAAASFHQVRSRPDSRWSILRDWAFWLRKKDINDQIKLLNDCLTLIDWLLPFPPCCQVVKLLGSKVQLVHKELLCLLQDDALEVSGNAHYHCFINQDLGPNANNFLWCHSLENHTSGFIWIKCYVGFSLEVLDALMTHVEETLEAVLSRGENQTLDNKVRK